MFPLLKYAGRLSLGACGAVVFMISLISPIDAWSAWQIGVLDSDGNVGRYAEAQIDDFGNMHLVYYRDDTSVLKVLSRISGVWQTPETPDASGQASGHCAITVDDAGVRRVSYGRGSALWYAGPELTQAWDKGIILSTSDAVGPSLALKNAPGGELSLSCRNVTQESLIFLMRDAAGVWGSPVTVDPGPGRGAHSDHAYRPGLGYAFSERDDADMLLFADPVIRTDTWDKGMVLSTSDNVGPSLALKNAPGGELSLSCRNVTQESLIFLMRDAAGMWGSPVTVDPGPNRGAHSDHAYRPGVGYAFSEADDSGILLFADPELGMNSWSIGTIYDSGRNGPHVSLQRLPVGNAVACSFFHYDEISLGAVYHTFLYESSRSTVTVVVDSIASDPADNVFVDLGVSSGLDFAIAYRRTRDPALCCAMADSSIVVAVGNPLDPVPYVVRADLHQNTPNPFNPSTRIRYEVPVGGGEVTIRIYDVAGRFVKMLVDGFETPGRKTITWDGTNEHGEHVASGVYFCRMEAAGFAKTVKVTLVR